MRNSEFIRMRCIEESENLKDLELGEHFLYGSRVIAQKTTKKIGDSISYFEVIAVNEETGNIEYTPVFDYLKKDREETK
jgi:hypothetical protein